MIRENEEIERAYDRESWVEKSQRERIERRLQLAPLAPEWWLKEAVELLRNKMVNDKTGVLRDTVSLIVEAQITYADELIGEAEKV